MTAFCDIPVNGKSVLITLFFLLNLCQYGYVILLMHYREKRLGYWNIIPGLIVFFSLPSLTRSLSQTDGLFDRVPVMMLLLIWTVMLAYTMAGIVHMIQKGHRILTFQSIKEAADKLPSGLVYFSESGLIILCNTRMQELYYQMSGHDLQMMEELENALIGQPHPAGSSPDEPVIILPDHSIWRFTKSEVHTEEQKRCTQFMASDLTQLYELREQISRDNESMQKMARQVQSITENIAEITRQEEILTAKMRVHNKMGNCMLAARQYLMSDLPHTPDDKEQLIRLWDENLRELKNEVETEDISDAYEMVAAIARDLGLEVALHGRMPEHQDTAYLLVVALRECVTNALNHAKADRLDMTVMRTDNSVIASYTNDGLPPRKPVREGGGLSSLRARIEDAGGELEVIDDPVFLLKVTLPLTEDPWIP